MEDTKIIDPEINLTSLRKDLDSIATLQNELLTMNTTEDEVEDEEEEGEEEEEDDDDEEEEEHSFEVHQEEEVVHEEDVVIDDNIVEVEIETEHGVSPTSIVTTVEQSTTVSETPIKIISSTASTPLSTPTLKAIAPKPVITAQRAGATKTNIINTGGQQIVLIQSPGGTANAVSLSTGQPIKLISQTGQSVTLPQFQTRQQLVKTTDGNLILRTTLPKTQAQTAGGSASLKTNLKRIVQTTSTPKKMIVTTPTTQTLKTDSNTQVVKIMTSTSSGSTSQTVTTPSKTISLAQAQEMGLLTSTQVQQLLPHPLGSKIIINKSASVSGAVSKQAANPTPTQLIKVTNQYQKSPTKILPAPKFIQKSNSGGPHKVLIKQGNQLKTGIINPNQQVLRIPANQINSGGQIHQINLPGQGVQYVRLVSTTNTNSANAVVASTVATSSTLTRSTTTSGTSHQQKLQTIVPVALVDRQGQNIVKVLPVSNNQASVRPVAPKTGTTQRTIVASSSTTPGKIATVPASSVSQLTTTLSGNSIVMLPTQYVQLQDISRSTPSSVVKVSPKIETTSKLTTDSILQEISSRSYQDSPSALHRSSVSETGASAARSVSSSSSGGFSTDRGVILGGNNNSLEPNGLRPRKPCNCTKSQCLKLYCDCFANGEFCHMCNCVNCFNNLDNEEERQKAIRSCLERNPSAFRPKIGKGRDTGENAVRKHTKGCNCKRSGCLKNYCECYERDIRSRIVQAKKLFANKRELLSSSKDTGIRKRLLKTFVWGVALYGCETWVLSKSERDKFEAFEMWCYRRMMKIKWVDKAKIACSNNCKCVGCRNIEDSLEKKSLRPIAPLINLNENSLQSYSSGSGYKSHHHIPSSHHHKSVAPAPYHKGRYLGYSTPNVAINFRPMLGTNTKQAFAFMTSEVIEATVQCLLASAEMTEKKGLPYCEMENTVIKEFGRCLVEIINTAKS